MKKSRTAPGFESRLTENLLGSLWGLISLPFRKKGPMFNRGHIAAAWQEIEQLADGSAQELKLAVVKADSLVDGILQRTAGGKTMGERLKNAESKFSHATYHNLWEAHKLRNRIAHEAHVEPHLEELRIAVARFRKALQEIGVL